MDKQPTHAVIMVKSDGQRVMRSFTAKNDEDAAFKARVWLAQDGSAADIKMVIAHGVRTARIAFAADQIEEAPDERFIEDKA
jgi:hypothetical protein